MKGKWKTRKGIYKYESKKADDNDRAGDNSFRRFLPHCLPDASHQAYVAR